jgi:hypothetical protein
MARRDVILSFDEVLLQASFGSCHMPEFGVFESDVLSDS